MSTSRSARPPLLAATLWSLACAAGFGAWALHAGRPGQPATAPLRWPAGAPAREPGHPALVMLIHPRCPCTAASLDELAWILARKPARAVVDLIFVRPAGEPAGWEEGGPSWRAAKALTGARVLVDADGSLAALFGARVSGQVLVYGASGDLAFSGGITESRGHRGDNDGRAAALAALGGGGAPSSWPVFGCSL